MMENQRFRHHDTLTYRFPRSTHEAFGVDAESAVAIRRYRKRQIMLAKWLVKAGAIGWVGLMVVGLMGCNAPGDPAPAQSTEQVDHLNARTYVVAVHDKCVVYYTKTTMGPDVNFVRCFGTHEDAAVHAQVKKSCGKNCTKYVTVATLAQ